MRKVSPGLVCIVLGVVLLLAAGGLYAYNRYEDAHAGAEAQTVVADLQQKVETPEPEAESGPWTPSSRWWRSTATNMWVRSPFPPSALTCR